MKEEILDRRVRKTRRQLKECLTRLLKEKKIQDITVRELAEMADINRGTFYLHYKDVFDLMDQIKNELIEEVESVLTHHPVPELVARPSLALSELFPLVQENAEIVSILIGENGDLNFVNRLKRIVSDKCLKGWLDLKCSSDPDQVIFDLSVLKGELLFIGNRLQLTAATLSRIRTDRLHAVGRRFQHFFQTRKGISLFRFYDFCTHRIAQNRVLDKQRITIA